MSKICTKCTKDKDLSEFRFRNGVPISHCKQCERDGRKAHYKKNPNPTKQSAKRSRARTLEKYIAYKKTLSCTDCGLPFKDEHYLCDFHHIDPTTKDPDAKWLRQCSFARFMKEVAKCVPVCSNCHRRRHYQLKQITNPL